MCISIAASVDVLLLRGICRNVYLQKYTNVSITNNVPGNLLHRNHAQTSSVISIRQMLPPVTFFASLVNELGEGIGVAGEGMGITQMWLMEANSGVRATSVPHRRRQGEYTQTDAQTHDLSIM